MERLKLGELVKVESPLLQKICKSADSIPKEPTSADSENERAVKMQVQRKNAGSTQKSVAKCAKVKSAELC